MTKKQLKSLPHFKSEKEEADFWASHDTADYFDMSTAEGLEPGTFQRSPRCSVDDSILLSRYVDVEVVSGRVVIRRLRQLYCRNGHKQETCLAPEAERRVRVIEAVALALEPSTGQSRGTAERVVRATRPEKLAA